jgi:hypothetical protein
LSKEIIASIRAQSQLSGNTFLIAKEIAHKMTNYDRKCRIAYSYLAKKAHCSIRTAFRQVEKLINLWGLFRKKTTRLQNGYDWNEYEYIGPMLPERPPKSTTALYDWMSDKFPIPAREEKKELSLEKKIADLKATLAFMTPGSTLYTQFESQLTEMEWLVQRWK